MKTIYVDAGGVATWLIPPPRPSVGVDGATVGDIDVRGFYPAAVVVAMSWHVWHACGRHIPDPLLTDG